jgi:hypothetical protein
MTPSSLRVAVLVPCYNEEAADAAVLSTGLTIVAVLSVSSGLVLDTVTRGRREMKLLAYLSEPPVVKT